MKKLLLFISLMLSVPAFAQLTAPGSNAVRFTSYLSETTNHPVFIYCSSNTSSPQLIANSPGGSPPYDFEWKRWDTNTSGFDIDLGIDIALSSSARNDLEDGGYSVRISDGAGFDTSLVAWIFTDNPVSNAGLKNFNCNYVALDGEAQTDPFTYFDVGSGQAISLPNDIEFMWYSVPESSIPNPGLNIDPVTYLPPLEDVDYFLQVTDSFGCVSESSFFYESIHVKADFEITPETGEAPLEVFITDNSVRANTYRWNFGDDTISTENDPVSHIYYKPGIYYITLEIESDILCQDSTRSMRITVDPSSLDIPNVFTPDGDGNNEFFIVSSRSLRSIDVQVFASSGKRVYYFRGEGDQLKDWQGWDGNIGSSKASPGIYYYIIRAIGWDNVVYDNKEYRGFVYLYR